MNFLLCWENINLKKRVKNNNYIYTHKININNSKKYLKKNK
jgi:hypothetical protein